MVKTIIIEVEQTFSIYDDNNLISKVKCVEDGIHSCNACVFRKTDTCNSMECTSIYRPNGVDVHFEYIEL